MNNPFVNFLNSSPHSNGFLAFVMGIVFVLTVYHFMLYFQHKKKTYIYYSTYTLLIFITYFSFSENDFLDSLTASLNSFFKMTHLGWVWIYNITYFFFVFNFLNFKVHYKNSTLILTKILYVLLLVGFCCLIQAIYSQSSIFLKTIYTIVFLPVIIVLTIYCFYLVYNSPEPTRKYIFIGSFILFISSVLGTLSVDFGLVFRSKETGYLVFYIGVIIENIFFSLGLGLRQKLIINERDDANQKLITNLKVNEVLKESVNKQLTEKIDALKKQISLKNEIDDLKLTSLRSQMNPHFIFNSLNSIKHYIINNEQKNAVFYLNKFSKLIRKILESSDVKEVYLKEELETIDLYMSIENIRFLKAITYTVTIDENVHLETIKVPPLFLQPFLENAIWHGLSSKKDKKKIDIHILKSDANYLQISIVDNGIGHQAAAKIKSEKFINRKLL